MSIRVASLTFDLKDACMYLILDTETTGLPLNWKAPVTDSTNWPRMVQLGWAVLDASLNLTETGAVLVLPQGFEIPAEAARIHRITQARALAEGQPLEQVLAELEQRVQQVTRVVAHNMGFDEMILGAEYWRQRRENPVAAWPKVCTMKDSAAFVGLPGKYGPKWPTLDELHRKLFGTGFAEAHDAGVDVAATARCYAELIRRKILH